MKVFVVGATGYLGIRLCLKLADLGYTVHALCRNKAKAKPLTHENIVLFEGDLSDTTSLEKAMQGCEQVYHLAAYASVWDKNPQVFYDINAKGTENVLSIAKKTGVSKIVVTSTAGVVGHSQNKELVAEDSNQNVRLETEYEKSKLEGEKIAFNYALEGLHVVIVNPSRIYGPGLMSDSNAATKLIKLYNEGKWRFIPGSGESMGNYVFVDDVVEGHLLAMEKGRSGQRYIIGGENASFNQYFALLRKMTGKKQRLFKIPLGFMLFFAGIQLFLADNFSRKPLIIPAFVRKYNHHWNLSSGKAEKELGYRITNLETGFQKTLDWLDNEKKQKISFQKRTQIDL